MSDGEPSDVSPVLVDRDTVVYGALRLEMTHSGRLLLVVFGSKFSYDPSVSAMPGVCFKFEVSEARLMVLCAAMRLLSEGAFEQAEVLLAEAEGSVVWARLLCHTEATRRTVDVPLLVSDAGPTPTMGLEVFAVGGRCGGGVTARVWRSRRDLAACAEVIRRHFLRRRMVV